MLSVNEETMQAYLKDNNKKTITIESPTCTDFKDVNWYKGDINQYGWGVTRTLAKGGRLYFYMNKDDNPPTSALGFFNTTYKAYATWISIGLAIKITEVTTEDSDASFKFGVRMKRTDNLYYPYKTIPIKFKDAMEEGERIVSLDSSGFLNDMMRNDFVDIGDMFIENQSDSSVKVKVGFSRLFMYLYTEGVPHSIGLDDYTVGYVKQGINPDNIIVLDTSPAIANITNSDLETESFSLTERLCSTDNIKFGLCESSVCEFTVVNRGDDWNGRTIKPYINTDGGERIPLGVFEVDSVRKQYLRTTQKKTITAYDKLRVMDTNAFNWYTSYMFGINTNEGAEIRGGLEFTRQIYSTYFNLAKSIGLETERAEADREGRLVMYQAYVSDSTPMKVITYKPDNYTTMTVAWAGIIVHPERTHSDKLYCPRCHNLLTDEVIDSKLYYYKRYIDDYGRGLIRSGQVLVEGYIPNEGWDKGFMVDSGDLFMIRPEWSNFIVYYPYMIHDGGPNSNYDITFFDYATLDIYNEIPTLKGGWNRLMYYDFYENSKEGTGNFVKTIYQADTSITARDAMRSLLEVCGCFFKLDRYGKPQFLYATKAGLFPSNELYPADTLYPREMPSITESMSQYSTFDCEDYRVTSYGKIQIVKKDRSNESKSFVQWEYVGNTSPNTYLIDDNIFYCNSEMEYEYDSMPEVQLMLENMFINISNLGYTPHRTQSIGLPYVETGDRITLLTLTGGIESFIFQRTLKGINHLMDTYEAKGDRINEEISEYAYKEWKGE